MKGIKESNEMDKSKFLGKIVGLYLIIISLAMVVNMPHFMVSVQNLVHDTSLMYVTGFFTLILGLIMIVSHNIWQWNWRLVITLIAWITLVKGTSIIFYPQLIDHMTFSFVKNINVAYITAGFDLILGIVLCYFGFKRG
jgi:hypothetical protein